MGSCTAQCKMQLFCANTGTIVRESAKFELACLKKEEEKTDFGGLATLWCGTFVTVIEE